MTIVREIVPTTVRGDRVKRLREKRAMTQAQLAADTGVAQSYLSEIERGATPSVGSDALVSVARALDTSVDYIVGLTDDPRSPTRQPLDKLTPEEEALIRDYRAIRNKDVRRFIINSARDAVEHGI